MIKSVTFKDKKPANGSKIYVRYYINGRCFMMNGVYDSNNNTLINTYSGDLMEVKGEDIWVDTENN